MVSEFGLTGNRSNPFSSICISPIYLLDMDSYFVCLFIHEGIKEHDIYIYIYIYIFVVQYFVPLILYFVNYYLS